MRSWPGAFPSASHDWHGLASCRRCPRHRIRRLGLLQSHGDAVRSEAYRFTILSAAPTWTCPLFRPTAVNLVYVTGAGLLRALDEDEAVRMDGTAGARAGRSGRPTASRSLFLPQPS